MRMNTNVFGLWHRWLVSVWLLVLFIPLAATAVGPTLTTPVVVDTPEDAPLARTLTFSTNIPTRVSVAIDDGLEVVQREFHDYRFNHAVPLYGFRPATTYAIVATAFDAYSNALVLPEPHRPTA